MQVYAEGKFRRGVTFKGVVDLSKGPMDNTTYTTAQATLYNKVFPLGQRETHRKMLEQRAGLESIQRPHPGLEKLRDQRTRHAETRKKRKLGDTVDEMVGMDSMRKMKMGLPTFTFDADEDIKKVAGKSHDGLVVYDKGKGKEKVEESGKKNDGARSREDFFTTRGKKKDCANGGACPRNAFLVCCEKGSKNLRPDVGKERVGSERSRPSVRVSDLRSFFYIYWSILSSGSGSNWPTEYTSASGFRATYGGRAVTSNATRNCAFS
ncbi:hypothetical protein E4T44_06815 [Aureobasidium sp. EXF-8845]|nr:hypothetical protein E4T44_06815 [Aureobasidium sp. EXF-8845]KAI4847404.1 hypothetical protein E4T45_06798 [Aureobasidium sp. EXF-8846]